MVASTIYRKQIEPLKTLAKALMLETLTRAPAIMLETLTRAPALMLETLAGSFSSL